MARYIDADVLKGALIAKLVRDINEDKAVKGMIDGGYHLALEDTLSFVSLMTPVEIVRCKDCVHGKLGCPEDLVCDYWDSDGLDSNDFCSSGERRKDEEA